MRYILYTLISVTLSCSVYAANAGAGAGAGGGDGAPTCWQRCQLLLRALGARLGIEEAIAPGGVAEAHEAPAGGAGGGEDDGVLDEVRVRQFIEAAAIERKNIENRAELATTDAEANVIRFNGLRDRVRELQIRIATARARGENNALCDAIVREIRSLTEEVDILAPRVKNSE